jgi:hypothetical protein
MQNVEAGSDSGFEADLVRVIILYENLESGKQARRTYDYLVESLQGVCVLSVQLWKFNLLEDPHLRLLALQDARQADIVIVASQGPVELPEGVRSWFDSWLKPSSQRIGLVALFQYPQQAARVRDYLREVAESGGVDFFAQPGASSNHLNPPAFAFFQ